MRLSTLLGTLALSFRTGLAADAQVHNKCSFPVWVTSVQDTAGPTNILPTDGVYSETQKPVDNGIGVSIQVTTSEAGPNNAPPILIMAYSWNNQTGLYYSLSTVNGFAFEGQKIRVHNTEGKALQEIVWVGDYKPDYTAAYLEGEAGITLELCDDFA